MIKLGGYVILLTEQEYTNFAVGYRYKNMHIISQEYYPFRIPILFWLSNNEQNEIPCLTILGDVIMVDIRQ